MEKGGITIFGYVNGIKVMSPEEVDEYKEIRRNSIIGQRFRSLISNPKEFLESYKIKGDDIK